MDLYNLPKEVQDIINSFDETSTNRHKECERLLVELKPYGYTFEYGLACEPFNFKKL